MNAYIEVLKFGRENGATTYNDLFNHLRKNKITFNSGHEITESNSLLQAVFMSCFQGLDGGKVESDKKGVYYLKPESLAYLLNYEGLKQAQKNSQYAFILGIVSFLIAAGTSIYSIYLQMK